jgi:hypothetical protein
VSPRCPQATPGLRCRSLTWENASADATRDLLPASEHGRDDNWTGGEVGESHAMTAVGVAQGTLSRTPLLLSVMAMLGCSPARFLWGSVGWERSR